MCPRLQPHVLQAAAPCNPGVLGASHWRNGPWQSLLRLLAGGTERFALDLNGGNASRLVLGGSYSAKDVAWSETQAAPDSHVLLLVLLLTSLSYC